MSHNHHCKGTVKLCPIFLLFIFYFLIYNMKKRLLAPTFLALLANVLFAQSPGGVSAHLKLWFKADAGVTATGWADQSGNGNNAVLSATAPILSTGAISNFNPSLAFNNGGYGGTFTTPITNNTVSAFVIYMGASNSSAGRGILSIAGNTAVDNTDAGSGVIFYNDVADAIASNRENVIRARSSGIRTSFRLFQMNFTGSDGQVLLYRDGTQSTPVAYTPQPAFSATKFAVGARLNATGPNTYQRGNIAEIILYDTLLTAAESQKVSSYLALKYGIALNPTALPNYTNGAGANVWDATLNTGYNFHVAGIGTDNLTGLNQPKTKNNTVTNILTLTSVGALANGSYTVVGNNGRIPYVTRAEDAPTGYFMSQAEYKVQVTGAPTSVVYGFSSFDAAQKIYLLIDTDKDGSYSDETPQLLNYNATSSDFEAAATLTNGQTFRLAYPAMEGLAWNNAMAGGNSGFFSNRSNQEVYAYVASNENLNLFLRKMRNGTNSSSTDGDMQVKIVSPSGIITNLNINNTEAAGKTLLTNNLTDAVSGIWSIKYTVAAGTGTSPGNPSNAQIADKYEWGAIVKNNSGQNILGRVYVKSISLTNEADAGTGQNGYVNSFGFYHQSSDGYRYRSTLKTFNGVDSRFATNNSGIVYNNTCVPYYKSIATNDTVASNAGADCNPFKQYFNLPDATMPNSAIIWDTIANASKVEWLNTDPTTPTVSIPSFTPNGGTAVPLDGNVNFTATNFSGNVWVDVDANGDGDYTDAEDRSIMVNVPVGGSGLLAFDGKNALGNDIDASVHIKFRVRITKLGEIHFVLADVEGIAGGMEVLRLNGSATGADLLYWNDTTLADAANCPSIMKNGLGGVPSTGGVHGWINDATGGSASCFGFGNNRFVDSWAFGADVNIVSDTLNFSLPVEIVSFKATTGAGCSINIQWKTASEQNNRKYIIQYSLDGQRFSDAGEVASKNQSQGADYSWIMKNPANGKMYFRLKAVDFDGRSTYSNVAVTTMDCRQTKIAALPNPVHETLIVTGLSGNNQLRIFTMEGKLVALVTSNASMTQIDVAHLPNGFYMVRIVKADGTTENIKIIKQ